MLSTVNVTMQFGAKPLFENVNVKFGEGYRELTDGLERAIEGISDMGESLRGMMRAIQDTDQALAGQ